MHAAGPHVATHPGVQSLVQYMCAVVAMQWWDRSQGKCAQTSKCSGRRLLGDEAMLQQL